VKKVNYAYIKDGKVINVAVFEDPTDPQVLDFFKDQLLLDDIVLATDKTVIDGTYDGARFWLPQPYPSWTKGTDDWEPPVAHPEYDEEDPKYYEWDEATTSWVEVTYSV
jgi:hypothetical protein